MLYNGDNGLFAAVARDDDSLGCGVGDAREHSREAEAGLITCDNPVGGGGGGAMEHIREDGAGLAAVTCDNCVGGGGGGAIEHSTEEVLLMDLERHLFFQL